MSEGALIPWMRRATPLLSPWWGSGEWEAEQQAANELTFSRQLLLYFQPKTRKSFRAENESDTRSATNWLRQTTRKVSLQQVKAALGIISNCKDTFRKFLKNLFCSKTTLSHNFEPLSAKAQGLTFWTARQTDLSLVTPPTVWSSRVHLAD